LPRALILSLLLVAAGALAGCAQAPGVASTPTRSAAPTARPTPAAAPTPAPSPTSSAAPVVSPSPAAGAPTPPISGAVVPPDAAALVDQAVSAVARQLGVPTAQVGVKSVQMVEWSDTSLGCPEPGMAYAQMVTPGYLILLSASGQTFEYHADRQDTVVSCASPRPPARVAG
jgi:hypothetical protein